MSEQDSDQREWLYREQQELLRVERRLARAHRIRWQVALALAALSALVLIGFVAWQLTRGPFD